jgi:hypothetical protein
MANRALNKLHVEHEIQSDMYSGKMQSQVNLESDNTSVSTY